VDWAPAEIQKEGSTPWKAEWLKWRELFVARVLISTGCNSSATVRAVRAVAAFFCCKVRKREMILSVQVLDVFEERGCLHVELDCCFCGEKHYHNTTEDLVLTVNTLGTRVAHCYLGGEYELRLDAWRSSGGAIKPEK
jgi:hypothetical protein